MTSVFTSLLLALRQLGEPAVLRVLLKSMAVSLVLFVLLVLGGWWAVDTLLELAGMTESRLAGADEVRGLAALVLALLGLWLGWRLVAMAVLQFFAEDVVRAVEARHYPQAATAARDLPWNEALRVSLASAVRALALNLVAMPFALLLLVTGIGPALLFWLLNAVLIGRELADMVWLRHAHAHPGLSPVSKLERLALGAVIAALFAVPFAALLAPVLGAAAAAHLVHRRTAA
jgi:CysZ protein